MDCAVPPQLETDCLAGTQVALTGRLAALPRAAAVELIRSLGGEYTPSVRSGTGLLVVGLDGWPLRSDGRVSRKLCRARRLQQRGSEVEILREDEWLARLGLHDLCELLCSRYPLDQLSQLLRISGLRIRTWVRAGLLRPVETVHGIPAFDFRQVTAVRRLDELTRAGVSAERLRRSLRQLEAWLPGAEDSLAHLRFAEEQGRLVFRTAEGVLVETTGQRLFEFGAEGSEQTLRYETPAPSCDQLFEEALEQEDAGDFGPAERLYRKWLETYGPDPQVCFNLGNVLYAQGRAEGALERFRQTIELDPEHTNAWCNLGCLLAETEQIEEAIAACRRAIELDPTCANALYNLADILQDQGRVDEARGLWEAYLRTDGSSEWSDYARACLLRPCV